MEIFSTAFAVWAWRAIGIVIAFFVMIAMIDSAKDSLQKARGKKGMAKIWSVADEIFYMAITLAVVSIFFFSMDFGDVINALVFVVKDIFWDKFFKPMLELAGITFS